MSSSVFIESGPVCKSSDESVGYAGRLTSEEDSACNERIGDSNLVVVYGKNGISFDRKGLESLIEEKTLASISVIRLSSPTPSMEEEEDACDKTIKQNESVRKQDITSGDDESYSKEDTTKTGERSAGDSSDELVSNNDDHESSDSDDACVKDNDVAASRKKGKYIRKPKNILAKVEKVKIRKHNKERPDIIGLTVEEFYPPEDAKLMAKEILKLAGVSSIKRTAEYEFQLYVIKNDHCYTPFTSPSQMKYKLATEKIALEKSSTNARKLIPQPALSMKHLISKRKQQSMDFPKVFISRKGLTEKERIDSRYRPDGKTNSKERSQKCDGESNENNDEDEETAAFSGCSEEEFEESDFVSSEASMESENDRDSDLDFNVNSRNANVKKRRRKRNKAAKRCGLQRGVSKRNPQHSQDDSESSKAFGLVTPIRRPSNDSSRVTGRLQGTPVKMANIRKMQLSGEASAAAVVKRQEMNEKAKINSVPHVALSTSMRRGPFVQMGALTCDLPLSNNCETSSQTIKEIAINKVIGSPKGGFTNIETLLAQPELEDETMKSTPILERPPPKTPTKGFMPLGIETAAKNKLPAQISIQTHQSSSELAAEHDKQLDLIYSIVKDELEKPSMIKKLPGEDENIPQLVKMLESTEMALESSHSQQMNTFEVTSTVDDIEDNIDIEDNPLLETSENELPDDILQHVVELMEDDKTLQEAVEKQVFGDEVNATVQPTVPNVLVNPTTIYQQLEKSEHEAILTENVSICSISPQSLPKSIIQATFSNAVPSDSLQSLSPMSAGSGLSTTKASSLARKEPVQIIRGNGRIITLPPIEAPTTRAKRRAAQTQPLQSEIYAVGDTSQTSFIECLESSLPTSTTLGNETGVTANMIMAEKTTPESIASRRRVSKEDNALSVMMKPSKRVTIRRATTKTCNKTDTEMSESQEDDDDPNRLWCICRQPHNNRFMICCDVCEDWFHGTCVNITKAMGTEMEQKGIDWTCPKCVKKVEDKSQRKITDMLEVKGMHLNQKMTTRDSGGGQINELAKYQTTLGSIVKTTAVTTPTTPSTATSKVEIVQRKFIDFKKLQAGKIIPFNAVKLPKEAISSPASGPRRTLLTSTPESSSTGPTKRVIMVQGLGGQRTLIPGGKSITVVKTPQQLQPSYHKFAMSTLNAGTVAITNRPDTEMEAPSRESTTICIMCNKIARANSIYCSDDCIRKHAQNALNAFAAKPTETVVSSPTGKVGTDEKKKKAKGLFEDVLSMADRKPKVERVYVYERKSGRVLTGTNAPTTLNLKKWLQDNPTFEVVQPGSMQSLEIEKKQKQRSSTFLAKLPSSTTFLLSSDNIHTHMKKAASVVHAEKGDGELVNGPMMQQKIARHMIETGRTALSSSVRPETPKQLFKHSQTVFIRAEKPHKLDDMRFKDRIIKRQLSENNVKKATAGVPIAPESNSSATAAAAAVNAEPIRLNVRRTLKEQLLLRVKEVDSDIEKRPTEEDIETFVRETEAEMYHYFNRDTGTKYKAKYRSLMFNIKDRKNQTLFQKICAKVIRPKQLVRMSPEEMASQELAQWREKETKHQLEMIKKSELDLLSCAKNYLLKTHKGEEVIESKEAECVHWDRTIPVEDVVSVLNNSLEHVDEAKSLKDHPHTDGEQAKEAPLTHSGGEFDANNSEERVKAGGRDRDNDRHREKEGGKRHKGKEHHRQKSKVRKRSRSRSRSLSREKRKSSHKNDKREKEERRTDSRDCERGKDRYRDKGVERKEYERKTLEERRSLNNAAGHSFSLAKEKHKAQGKREGDSKSHDTFSLIDQILESSKTLQEAANMITEERSYGDNFSSTSSQSNVKVAAEQGETTTEAMRAPGDVSFALTPQDPYVVYQQEGNNAILWSGSINMIDVTSFEMIAQSVVGNAFGLGKLLSSELEIVGRIGPDTVWDYISKIKKSPNKEIVILRLLPASETETAAYTILYQYLNKRNRLGVVKVTCTHIKDFYLFPLGSGCQMPMVLQPPERVEFYDDTHRPDVLVGIIIRVIGKRTTSSTSGPSEATKFTKISSKMKESDVFTPPSSPKRKRSSTATKASEMDIDAIIKAPIVAKKNMPLSVPVQPSIDDLDEPYTPGGSSDDDMPPIIMTPSKFQNSAEDELKRKMDELNRQIAAQEMEIAGLLSAEPTKFVTPTNAAVLNPSLASISIPSNLSQILASIKSKPEQSSPPDTTPPPPPLIGSLLKIVRPDVTTEHYSSADIPIDVPYKGDVHVGEKTTSLLAQLSEAELLSMVPDDVLVPPPPTNEPPPPGV